MEGDTDLLRLCRIAYATGCRLGGLSALTVHEFEQNAGMETRIVSYGGLVPANFQFGPASHTTELAKAHPPYLLPLPAAAPLQGSPLYTTKRSRSRKVAALSNELRPRACAGYL